MCSMHLHVHVEMRSTIKKGERKTGVLFYQKESISSTISEALGRFKQESWHQSPRPLFVLIEILVLPLSLDYESLTVCWHATKKNSWRIALVLLNKVIWNVYMMTDKT